MLLNTGKFAGKTTEYLVLKEPAYVDWCIGNYPNPTIVNNFKSLIKKFDQKPFVVECLNQNCKNTATRASVYQDNPSPYFWCDNCDPYGYGAIAGKLTIIATYQQALSHVKFWSSARKGDMAVIIAAMARAKGAPARLTAIALSKFF